MEGDPLNKVISMVVAFIIGIVLVVGAVLPIAGQQLEWLNGSTDTRAGSVPNVPGLDYITGGVGGITALLSVAVIMVIIGLVIGIVSYLRSDR